MVFVWNDDAVAVARRLYMVEGLSATETARAIGSTRSAVISKAHRMGWAEQRSPVLAQANLIRLNRGRPPRDPGARAPRWSPRAAPGPRPIVSNPRHWLDRHPGECAYPVAGEGEDLISCCAPSGRQTYCPGHHALMHRKNPERTPAAQERLAAWVDARDRRKPGSTSGREGGR